jgi:cytochrome c5
VAANHPSVVASSSGAAASSSETFPCPLCAKVSRNTNALQVHLNTQHGVTAGEVYGGTCPLCNHEGTPSGLGTHARMAHRVDGGVPALFREAVAAGDPYGVFAGRAAVIAGMLGATG